MADHLAFYGKGGVGKSTLVSNVSAALTEAGFRVLQVGCSPAGDSSITLNSGRTVPTVCSLLEKRGHISADEALSYGFKGVASLEIGVPGTGSGASASAGFRQAFSALEQERVFELVHADMILYDISGEGCFEAYCQLFGSCASHRIFVVTSADFMSLRAANDICAALNLRDQTQVPIPAGGLIPNNTGSSFEDSFIADFARQTGLRVLGRIPRSLMVRQCELYGKTVIEASPLSNQSYYYRRLANQIVDVAAAVPEHRPPEAMTPGQMGIWARGWADRLFAIENGLVSEGASI